LGWFLDVYDQQMEFNTPLCTLIDPGVPIPGIKKDLIALGKYCFTDHGK
jgi:hypothetical protein